MSLGIRRAGRQNGSIRAKHRNSGLGCRALRWLRCTAHALLRTLDVIILLVCFCGDRIAL